MSAVSAEQHLKGTKTSPDETSIMVSAVYFFNVSNTKRLNKRI